MRNPRSTLLISTLLGVALTACAGGTSDDSSAGAADDAGPADGLQAFTAAWVVDGTGAPPIEGGAVLVRDGLVEAVGPLAAITYPEGTEVVDLGDTWLVPGLINAHGHVSGDRAAALDQLEQYAHYGITTVVSLGGEDPAWFDLRDQQSTPGFDRARVFVAGPVINPSTVEEARSEVARIADMEADWVKIRVDDGLDTRPKMSPEVYGEVIAAAHDRGLPVAIHIVDLEDAIGAVEAGGDLIGHSVRDTAVDQSLIDAMVASEVCLVPTLTREVSTFVYAARPDFFDDPFFLERAAPEDLESFLTPGLQASQTTPAAEFYREALPLAQQNMVRMHEGGVGVAMGTDTGPTGRFQGYFEHMEMELMAGAGMSSEDVLRSATGVAAECMGLAGEVGTLEPGAYADLLVLDANPLESIQNARQIHSVWIAGNRIR